MTPPARARNAPAWTARARRCVVTSTAFRSRGPRMPSNRPPESRDEYTPSATMPCRATSARPRAAALWPIAESYCPDVSPAHNKSESVRDALDALDGGAEPERSVLRDAVRALLAEL